MRIVFAVVVGVFIADGGFAQVREILSTEHACNYTGGVSPSQVYTFSSNQDALDAVARIMAHTGLPQNFEVEASSTPNAAAVVVGDSSNRRRIILYNEQFMDRIASATSDWAALSVLAHEIGHHLAGHTLQRGAGRPTMELEADRFSGFILAKMGATAEQAQSAVRQLPEAGSATHPPRDARLTAVYNGWRAAASDLAPGPRPPDRREPGPEPEPIRPPAMNNTVSGTWEGGPGFTYQLVQDGSEVTIEEHVAGVVTAAGRGTITGQRVNLEVILATFEPVRVQLELSRDGRNLEGEIVNLLGGRTPIRLRRLNN